MEHIGPGLSSGAGEEPLVGFEPTTARLRIECSTTELRWLTAGMRDALCGMRNSLGSELPRRSRSHPASRIPQMPWRGLEPRRLAAPPPQDGVSTNFTTRAFAARTPRDVHTFRIQHTAIQRG